MTIETSADIGVCDSRMGFHAAQKQIPKNAARSSDHFAPRRRNARTSA